MNRDEWLADVYNFLLLRSRSTIPRIRRGEKSALRNSHIKASETSSASNLRGRAYPEARP